MNDVCVCAKEWWKLNRSFESRYFVIQFCSVHTHTFFLLIDNSNKTFRLNFNLHSNLAAIAFNLSLSLSLSIKLPFSFLCALFNPIDGSIFIHISFSPHPLLEWLIGFVWWASSNFWTLPYTKEKGAVRLVYEIRGAIKWWWLLCVWEWERESEKCNQWIHWRQIMEKCARAYLFYFDIWHATNNNKDDLQNGLFLREYVFTCVLVCMRAVHFSVRSAYTMYTRLNVVITELSNY